MVRRMRLVVLLGLMMLGAVATTAAPVGAVTAFSNDKVAVGIADGWQQDSNAPAGIIGQWVKYDGGAVFNITHETVPDGTTNVDYAQANVAGVASSQGYKELRRDFVNSGDQRAPRLDYIFMKDGTLLRAQQVFLTHGTDAYVLTYVSQLVDHSDYVDEVDVMVYSFTFAS